VMCVSTRQYGIGRNTRRAAVETARVSEWLGMGAVAVALCNWWLVMGNKAGWEGWWMGDSQWMGVEPHTRQTREWKWCANHDLYCFLFFSLPCCTLSFYMLDVRHACKPLSCLPGVGRVR
jgi:hypothetical protein